MSNPYAPPTPGKRPSRDRRGGNRDGETAAHDDERPDRRGSGAGRAPEGAARHTDEGGPGGPQPSGRAPAPRSAPKEPGPPRDPKAVEAAQGRVRTFALLMLATVLTYSLPLPWSAGAVVFSVAGIVVGVLATRALRRAGVRGPMITMMSLFVGFAVLLSLSLLTMLALYPLQAEREACLRDALTISAQEQCEEEWEDAVRNMSPGTGIPTD